MFFCIQKLNSIKKLPYTAALIFNFLGQKHDFLKRTFNAVIIMRFKGFIEQETIRVPTYGQKRQNNNYYSRYDNSYTNRKS
jgi:hypothetical protein